MKNKLNTFSLEQSDYNMKDIFVSEDKYWFSDDELAALIKAKGGLFNPYTNCSFSANDNRTLNERYVVITALYEAIKLREKRIKLISPLTLELIRRIKKNIEHKYA